MIKRKKSKHEILNRFFNIKLLMVVAMVSTFMVFAFGSSPTIDSQEIASIMVGAGLFALASAMLLKAGEISKNLYR